MGSVPTPSADLRAASPSTSRDPDPDDLEYDGAILQAADMLRAMITRTLPGKANDLRAIRRKAWV